MANEWPSVESVYAPRFILISTFGVITSLMSIFVIKQGKVSAEDMTPEKVLAGG